MKRWLGVVAITLCSTVVQAAERPGICSSVASLPMKYQRPFEDLGGKLPVPDYLDSVLACTHEAVMEDTAIPRPEWLVADAKRYRTLLARGKYQWLVLPAQTQYYGFDNIERELIGAEGRSSPSTSCSPTR